MGIYVPSDYEQMAFFPPNTIFHTLSKSIQDDIEKSYDGFFRKEIIPIIPSNLIERLYSTMPNTRPSNGFYVAAALIYMRAVDITEEYFLQHVFTDASIQYALKTEDLLSQPFSERSFGRFRERIAKYNEENEADIWNEITHTIDLELAEKIKSNKRFSQNFEDVYRIDSMMVECHGSNMTRLELLQETLNIRISNPLDYSVKNG